MPPASLGWYHELVILEHAGKFTAFFDSVFFMKILMFRYCFIIKSHLIQPLGTTNTFTNKDTIVHSFVGAQCPLLITDKDLPTFHKHCWELNYLTTYTHRLTMETFSFLVPWILSRSGKGLSQLSNNLPTLKSIQLQ